MYIHQHDPDYLLQQLLEIVGYQPEENTAEWRDPAAQRQIVYETDVNGIRFTVTCASISRAPDQPLLSPREQEITKLIIQGLPNKTIAAVLNISPWTVGTYIKRIFAKLNVNTRAEVVARVLQERLLEARAVPEVMPLEICDLLDYERSV